MTTGSLSALISFVLISTFTPGPANISSTSMGILYGYRRSFRYLVGLMSGVGLMMVLSALISTALLGLLPSIEPVLRIVGAAYILYLAFAILKASYTFEADETEPLGYGRGVLLQVLNPKLAVYALTLFTTFLAPLTSNVPLLLLAALLLALTAFCAVSVWALFGSAIKDRLRQPRVNLAVNGVLALFLVYSAAEVAGIL